MNTCDPHQVKNSHIPRMSRTRGHSVPSSEWPPTDAPKHPPQFQNSKRHKILGSITLKSPVIRNEIEEQGKSNTLIGATCQSVNNTLRNKSLKVCYARGQC